MSDSTAKTKRLTLKLLLAGAVALAMYSLGAPLIRRMIPARGPAPIELHSGKELPAWKPGPGWLFAREERSVGPDGRLSLPLYPPFTDEPSATLFERTRGEVFDELCGDRWQPNLDELLGAIHLARTDLESPTRMADTMLAHLSRLGVESVDLRRPLAASAERLYWKFDCHLGLAGHRLVASELAPILARQ